MNASDQWSVVSGQLQDPDRFDYDAALALLTEHLCAHPGVSMELDAIAAHTLVGNLQLALRHPANRGEAAELGRMVCDALIEALADGNESIAAVLRLGDDEWFDVRTPEN